MGKRIPIATGEFYHIYNRGTDKRIIFQDNNDYRRFLDGMLFFNSDQAVGSLYELSFTEPKQGKRLVEIIAYNLLNNHFHIVVRQLQDGGVSKFMKSLAGGYATYFNLKNKRSGSLFQGPYKIKHISRDEYLSYVLAYVHFNDKVHSLGDRFPKSSIQELKDGIAYNKHNILLNGNATTNFATVDEYEKYAVTLVSETIKRRKMEQELKYKTELVDLFME